MLGAKLRHIAGPHATFASAWAQSCYSQRHNGSSPDLM